MMLRIWKKFPHVTPCPLEISLILTCILLKHQVTQFNISIFDIANVLTKSNISISYHSMNKY